MRASRAVRLGVLIGALCAAACGRKTPDTLYLLADRDVEGLDPHASGAIFQTQNLLANVYEGLVARDPDMRLRPGLAVSWSNPDEHTWDFVLRPGVRFHDGAAMEAQDAVFSLRRALDHPGTVVKTALANVAEISSPAAGIVRLRTREPDASLLARLRDVYVVSRRGVETAGADPFARTSFGTGAYRVVSRGPGVVVVERFDAYWGAAPFLRRVHFLSSTYDTPEARAQVPEGAALMFSTPPGTPRFMTASRDFLLHDRPGISIHYLGFDLRDRESPSVRLPKGVTGNPFRDRRVREAIALALDPARMKQDIFAGRAVVASQVVPPEVLGFDPKLPPPQSDLAAAQRLMAETPYEAGFEVDLDVRELVVRYARPVADDLQRLGIRVTPRTADEPAFFQRLRAGQSSLYLLRFSCRTGDAQEFFDKWVHSRDAARGYGEFNYSYDEDPVPGLDAQIEAARRTLDPNKRLDQLQAVMRRVMEERLVIPFTSEHSLLFLSRDFEWRPRADTFRLAAEIRPAAR